VCLVVTSAVWCVNRGLRTTSNLDWPAPLHQRVVAGHLRPARRAIGADRRKADLTGRGGDPGRDGLLLHPGWAVGFRPGRAVREAHRQAQKGGLSDDPPSTVPSAHRRHSPPLSDPSTHCAPGVGTMTGQSSFPPFAEAGLWPARVVAQHRGLWLVVGANGEAFATPTGRLRHRADEGDLPAVEIGSAVSFRLMTARRGLTSFLARRSTFRRKAAGSRLAAQVVAANVDTIFVATSLDAISTKDDSNGTGDGP